MAQIASPTVPLTTSAILESLLAEAPADQIGIGWLFAQLRDRSFGISLLVVALIAMMPGGSGIAAPILAIPALQMLLGYESAALPGILSRRSLPGRPFRATLRRAVPVLREMERRLQPRWRTIGLARRIVGGIVLLLCLCLLAPIPFSQVPPAGIIALIAFAYLQEDAILVWVAALLAIGTMVGTSVAVVALAGAVLF
jgi:hypothetical protein